MTKGCFKRQRRVGLAVSSNDTAPSASTVVFEYTPISIFQLFPFLRFVGRGKSFQTQIVRVTDILASRELCCCCCWCCWCCAAAASFRVHLKAKLIAWGEFNKYYILSMRHHEWTNEVGLAVDGVDGADFRRWAFVCVCVRVNSSDLDKCHRNIILRTGCLEWNEHCVEWGRVKSSLNTFIICLMSRRQMKKKKICSAWLREDFEAMGVERKILISKNIINVVCDGNAFFTRTTLCCET